MNRRSFLSAMLLTGIAPHFLPGGGRIWKVTCPQVVLDHGKRIRRPLCNVMQLVSAESIEIHPPGRGDCCGFTWHPLAVYDEPTPPLGILI